MSVNKVILVGNVGRDPEVRYVSQDTPVANFTLATTERGYTAQNGTQVPERTEWHNIVAWRGLAKLTENYIRKGSSLYIEGKLRTRNYQDQNGNTRYVTEIYADEIQLLGKKPEGGVTPLQQQPAANNSAPYQAQPSAQPNPQPAQQPAQAAANDPEDELPF